MGSLRFCYCLRLLLPFWEGEGGDGAGGLGAPGRDKITAARRGSYRNFGAAGIAGRSARLLSFALQFIDRHGQVLPDAGRAAVGSFRSGAGGGF